MYQKIILVFCFVCYQWSLLAQTDLPCNQPLFTTNLVSQDYIIPEGTQEIYMKIRGGDGGDAFLSGNTCDTRVAGGAGAVVEATFEVGTASDQLQVGGKLRIYVGQAGESENTVCSPPEIGVHGAGGGASGIVYLPPNRANTNLWSVLMVAGAGGGGNRGSSFRVGKGGNSGTNGDSAGPAPGGTENDCPLSSQVGTGAQAWAGASLNCGITNEGRGDRVNGLGGVISSGTDRRIQLDLPGNTTPANTGGTINNQPKGGDGITGGGASDGGGGGGGGFYGGGASTNWQGGGGGSFLSLLFRYADGSLTDGADGGGIEGSGEATVSANVILAAPNIVCRDTTIYKNENGLYTLTPDRIDGGTTANCNQAVTLSFAGGINTLNLDCSQLTQQVTLVATTSPTLSSTCQATITLVDTVPPTIACKDTTLYLGSNGSVSLAASDLTVDAADDCQLSNVVLNQTSFNCTNLGTQTVLLTATDASNNQDTCTATITILDTLPPVPNNNVADTLYFACGGTLVDQPTATDNCSGNIDGTTNDPLTYTAGGTYTVTWTYADAAGNTSTSEQTVIVQAGVIYVDSSAQAGQQTGDSWADAFSTLQQALDKAENCDGVTEIWVADGIYIPTKVNSNLVFGGNLARKAVFYIAQDGIQLYGGFSGLNGAEETSRSQRNPDLYLTILDGDRGAIGTASDNCYRVIYLDGTTANGVLTSATVVDGFTIQNGNADFLGANSGSGMYIAGNLSTTNATNPIINNCTFTNNNASFAGAGIYLAGFNGNCSPTITNCTFSSNTATNFGAGIHFDAADGIVTPVIQNCFFTQNTANLGAAINIGGFGNEDLRAQINNCVFDSNGASHIRYEEGAANQQPSFTNCTFFGATTEAIRIGTYGSSNSPLGFTNCIFWDNASITNTLNAVAVSYSLLGIVNNNDFAGNNNILNQNPIFKNTANGDFSIAKTSVGINTGNNTAVGGIITDFNGNPRISGCTVDRGAYELLNPVVNKSRLYVNQAVVGGSSDGSSWANAFTDLQDALDAFSTECHTEIWVAQGTYRPTKANPVIDNSADKNKSFYINTDGLKIYGGFSGNGTETTLTQRDLSSYPTILDGDLLDNDDDTLTEFALSNNATRKDNALHVVYIDGKSGENITNATVIDGFTIQNGNASSIGGGGMYVDAGFFNKTANPQIINCIFRKNASSGTGGALINYGTYGVASPTIENCQFIANFGISGGAIYNEGQLGDANPQITNCLFAGNWAGLGGGALYNNGLAGDANPTVTNCTFYGNISDFRGGGIRSWNAEPVIQNCIFWENAHLGATDISGADINDGNLASSTVTYCLTQIKSEYRTGTGIINGQDPLFVDALTNDFRLQNCSPAIDAGNNSAINGISIDLADSTRVVNNTVDIGAYEYQSSIENTVSAPAVKDTTYCEGETAIALTATATGTLTWYDAATNGNVIDTPTPSTNTAGTQEYWVSQSVGTCESARAKITVTVNAKPTAPTVNDVTYCQGETATALMATATGTITWYDAAVDGNIISTPTPSTATIGTQEYWVTQTIGSCESVRAKIVVTISNSNRVDYLGVSTIQSSDSLFAGADTITTEGTVTIPTNDSIIFEASEVVVLKAGFSVAAGATFTARIGTTATPCNSTNLVETANESRSLEIQDIPQKLTLRVHPNPTRHNATITFELSHFTQNVQLQLFNLQGKQLQSWYNGSALAQGHYTVPLAGESLEAGLYVLRLHTNDGVQTQKLVVQR
ncbi:MAG: choice-of-anchor Q domain-containing protein [Bacteroidota bacterium]